jgi:hypothetical protein
MLAARPLGSRTLGDGTGDSGANVTPVVVVTAAVAFTVDSTLTPMAAHRAAVAFTVETDLDLLGALKRDAGPLRFTVEADLRARTYIRGKDYRLVLTDLAGNRYAEFPGASFGDPSWGLNGDPGGLAFALSQDDPRAAMVIPIEREIQLWKGDTLLWAGPIIRPQANSKEAGFQAATPEWHFSRRHFGKADRTNYLGEAGDFEGAWEGYFGFGGWEVGAASPLEPVAGLNPAHWEDEVSSVRAVTGSRSLRIEQVASGQPKYGVAASHYFTWEVDPDLVGEEGDIWTLTAYCYIPSDEWRGPRLDRYGLGLGRYSTTETISITREGGGPTIVYPAPIEGGQTTIDETHPRDRWVRHQVTLSQPVTGEPELVAVRLHAPNGTIFWDRVSLTLEESLHFEQTDQALIAAGIVEHLQDPAYGKSDLGLALHTPLTGVKRDRTYRHSEHGKGMEALSEFPALDDGLDWDIQVTPAGRTFRTHYPRKGVDRSNELTLEWGRNIVDFNWGWDGEAAASSVIMLGTGDGSSREEGFAEDPTLYGGVTLEDVSVAPETDTYGQIDTLDNRATERLRTVRNPTLLEVQVREVSDYQGHQVPLLGILQTGDLVRCRIHRGIVDIDGVVYRIVRMSLNPTSEILTLVLNWWADA